MIKNRKIENVQWIRCDIYASNTEERLKATINDKVCIVPKDPLNSDYEEILERVAAGTLTIKDAE